MDDLLELLIIAMFLTVSVSATVTSVVSIVVSVDVAVVTVASRIDNNNFRFLMVSMLSTTRRRAIDREVKVKVQLRGLGHESHATREKSSFKHF